MRGLVESLLSPRPILAELPAVYHDDGFASQLVGALDECLAPLFLTLDCLDAYLDPLLSPVDILDWLGGWVGTSPEPGLSVRIRREMVARAVALHRERGTKAGLEAIVYLAAGVIAEIEDPGGLAWSQSPSSELPGIAGRELVVRLRARDLIGVDTDALARLVRAATPAHLGVRLEVDPEGFGDEPQAHGGSPGASSSAGTGPVGAGSDGDGTA